MPLEETIDHYKSTGSTGQMLIRDTGTYVEYWLNSHNSTTFNYSLPWASTINGNASGWKYFRYEKGAGWERLGRANVTYSQTVTFKLGDTGTVGFGGPTTFSVAISRSKAPNPPSIVALANVTSHSVFATFSDGANNGATIDTRQIGYGTSSSTPQITVTSDKSTDITGLNPGTKYYFWARTHNSEGWSSWGPRSDVTTPTGVKVNVGGVWKSAIPYVKTGGVWKLARPWIRSGGIWKEAQ